MTACGALRSFDSRRLRRFNAHRSCSSENRLRARRRGAGPDPGRGELRSGAFIGRVTSVDVPNRSDLSLSAVAYAVAVADYYLVTRAKGPAWDHSRRRREQAGWDEHAAFMDALVDDGLIVLGGPVGEGDGEDTLAVIDAESEAVIRERLAEDPWPSEMLVIKSIEPWSVWLRRE
jgi:uncharacterized protein YciI